MVATIIKVNRGGMVFEHSVNFGKTDFENWLVRFMICLFGGIVLAKYDVDIDGEYALKKAKYAYTVGKT